MPVPVIVCKRGGVAIKNAIHLLASLTGAGKAKSRWAFGRRPTPSASEVRARSTKIEREWKFQSLPLLLLGSRRVVSSTASRWIAGGARQIATFAATAFSTPSTF